MELSKVPAEIRNENLRAEYAGADRKPAVDLKLQCKAPADVLAFFAPTLRAHLFDDGIVRYPQLGKFGWSVTFEPCTLHINGVRIAGAVLKDFSMEAHAEGTEESEQVALSFTAAFHPEPGQVEKLHKLLLEEVSLSIEHAQGKLNV
jgi:hypothetical protein